MRFPLFYGWRRFRRTCERGILALHGLAGCNGALSRDRSWLLILFEPDSYGCAGRIPISSCGGRRERASRGWLVAAALSSLNLPRCTSNLSCEAQLREDSNRLSLPDITEAEQRSWKWTAADWATHMPELGLTTHTGLQNGSRYGLTRDVVDWHSRTLHISRTKNPHTSQ